MPPEIKHSNNTLAVSEEIDAAYIYSIAEAEKFGDPSTIVKVENKLAHCLMAERRYKEAVPLLRKVAQFQELQPDKTELAPTLLMLSSCLSHFDDSESLQEGIEYAEKAIKLYGDSEKATESKKSAIVMEIIILNKLNHQTGENDYKNKARRVYTKNATLFVKDQGINNALAEEGIVENFRINQSAW